MKQRIKNKTIDQLPMSVRLRGACKFNNLQTLADIVSMTDKDFLLTPNFGKTSLEELYTLLTAYGLHLGMKGKVCPTCGHRVHDDFKSGVDQIQRAFEGVTNATEAA